MGIKALKKYFVVPFILIATRHNGATNLPILKYEVLVSHCIAEFQFRIPRSACVSEIASSCIKISYEQSETTHTHAHVWTPQETLYCRKF